MNPDPLLAGRLELGKFTAQNRLNAARRDYGAAWDAHRRENTKASRIPALTAKRVLLEAQAIGEEWGVE